MTTHGARPEGTRARFHDPGRRRWRDSLPAATLAFLLLAGALTATGHRLRDLSGGAPKLDFLWAAAPAVYRAALEHYGPAGRTLYLVLNAIDMAFPLSVAWLGILLLRRALPAGGWLRVVPLAFAALDLAENVLLYGLLLAWPGFDDRLAIACAAVTTSKLTALAASYALILATLPVVAVAWWRRGRRQRPTRDRSSAA